MNNAKCIATKQYDMTFVQICPQEGYDTALEIQFHNINMNVSQYKLMPNAFGVHETLLLVCNYNWKLYDYYFKTCIFNVSSYRMRLT